MSEWISVKDRLPERGQYVLMVVKSYGYEDIPDQKTMETGCYGYFDGEQENSGWCYLDPGGCGEVNPLEEEFEKVTHWMPLPDMPNEVKGEEGNA